MGSLMNEKRRKLMVQGHIILIIHYTRLRGRRSVQSKENKHLLTRFELKWNAVYSMPVCRCHSVDPLHVASRKTWSS